MQSPPGTPATAVTRQMPPVAVGDTTSSLPPAPALVSASGEACANCGAAVAADQRYCVECGERRGEPRLPFMDGRSLMQTNEPPPPALTYGAYSAAPTPPKNKWSSGLAMLATLGLLLLAMGVGVLIGNDGGSSKAAAQQPIMIGGTGATTATGASGATADTASKDAAASASASDANGNTSSGVDAQALAKKNGVKLAPPSVDLGEKCPKGSVGCSTDGKFTGDYFK